jgi:hypothetical protein
LRSTIRARSMVPTSKGGHGFACEAVASTALVDRPAQRRGTGEPVAAGSAALDWGRRRETQ